MKFRAVIGNEEKEIEAKNFDDVLAQYEKLIRDSEKINEAVRAGFSEAASFTEHEASWGTQEFEECKQEYINAVLKEFQQNHTTEPESATTIDELSEIIYFVEQTDYVEKKLY